MPRIASKSNGADLLIVPLEYCIIIIDVLVIGSIWTRISDAALISNGELNLIASVLIILLAVILGVKNGFFIKRGHMMWIMVCGLCMVLTLYKNASDIIGAMASLYLPILSALLLASFMRLDDFGELINRFTVIVLILSSVSLFFWVFGSFLHWIPTSGNVSFGWDRIRSATSYYGLYYEPAWQRIAIPGYGMLQKNCGIFTETPMFCFLVSTAYCLYRTRPTQSMWVRIIFLATIISAINTTSITAIIAFEVIKYALENNVRSRNDILKFILLPCVGVVGIYAVYALVIAKLETGSGSIRFDHLASCFKALIYSFPFGTGVGSDDYIIGLGEYDQGMSVGLPYLFAQGGLGAVMVIFVPSMYLFVKTTKAKRWDILAFLISFLWSLFCTQLVYRCHLYWILICYFVNYGSALKNSADILETVPILAKRKPIRLVFGSHESK